MVAIGIPTIQAVVEATTPQISFQAKCAALAMVDPPPPKHHARIRTKEELILVAMDALGTRQTFHHVELMTLQISLPVNTAVLAMAENLKTLLAHQSGKLTLTMNKPKSTQKTLRCPTLNSTKRWEKF